MKAIHFVSLLILTLFYSCGGKSADPVEAPKLEKFELTYFDGGGMIDMSERIFISDTLCYWQYHRYGRETLVNYQLSKEEMNALTEFLIEHHYDEIESDKKGFVADRGGSVISIKQESGVLELNNNGSFFIGEKWLSDYNAIKDYIYDLNETKVEALKIDVMVKLDESLFSSPNTITCDFNGRKVFESIEGDLNHSFQAKAYPGLNELTVFSLMTDSIDVNGKNAVELQQNLFVECAQDQQITVGMVDGKIVEIKD